VGFEVFTAVIMKGSLFLDTAQCCPMKVNRRCGGTSTSACCLLHSGFLLDLLFNPEDRGNIFLRKVGLLSSDYTASYPRRLNSLCPFVFIEIYLSVENCQYNKISLYIQHIYSHTEVRAWGTCAYRDTSLTLISDGYNYVEARHTLSRTFFCIYVTQWTT
jgi:hypothetical protein